MTQPDQLEPDSPVEKRVKQVGWVLLGVFLTFDAIIMFVVVATFLAWLVGGL